MIQDYDAVLDARYGKEGTPERVKFEEDAYAYYTGLILRDARKDAKVSQAELARRTQTTKSYISRIENGVIIPSVAVFYRMIAALGMTVEIVRPAVCGYGLTSQTKYLSEPEQTPYGNKK
jgi:transcriptional regulator with XRE-family HTH domain